MRVTSASASASSLATKAASRPLCEPARSEPAITRILGPYMPKASGFPVDPYPRRRDVHPDALGRLHREAIETARQRRGHRIGELHERRARQHEVESVADEPHPLAHGLVTSGRPETTAAAGC